MHKLVLLLASFAFAEKLVFNQVLQPSVQQCYLENLSESVQGNYLFIVLAIVEVSSDAQSLTFAVTDPKGKKLETQSGKGEFRYHFAAFTAGNH